MLWLVDACKCQTLQVRICKRTELFIWKGLHLVETYTLLLHYYYTFQGRKNRALVEPSPEGACMPCSEGIGTNRCQGRLPSADPSALRFSFFLFF